VIWLGVVLYVVLGVLYSIEAAARLDAMGGDDEHPWPPHEFVLVGFASLFWPLALLAMLWYWGFEWRAEYIRKRVQDAAG
jgi:hypothetical protein